jgi:hypothetical protein
MARAGRELVLAWTEAERETGAGSTSTMTLP